MKDCTDGSDEPSSCVESGLKPPSKCEGDHCITMNTTASCDAPKFYRCGKKMRNALEQK